MATSKSSTTPGRRRVRPASPRRPTSRKPSSSRSRAWRSDCRTCRWRRREAIVESGRKDLQALVKANEKSYEGLQAVVQRQTEMLKTSIEEWQGP